jgi:hypothetical protein
VRLRQIVLAAADLRATRTAIEDELGLPHVWADPGVGHFGLRNALYAVGDSFVEVVSPLRADAPVRRFIDRAGGDGGYMALVQTTDPLADVQARAAALGIRVVFTAEGEGVTGLHFHPADTDGTLLSADRCDDEPSWPWAGPAWEAAPDRGYTGITGAWFAVDDPDAVASRWAALLGTAARGPAIAVDGAVLRFEPSSPGHRGLCAVTLAGPPRSPVTIAGVTFTVV